MLQRPSVFRTGLILVSGFALAAAAVFLALKLQPSPAEGAALNAVPATQTDTAGRSNRLIVEFGSPALAEVYARERFAEGLGEWVVPLDHTVELYALQLENEREVFQETLNQEFPEIVGAQYADTAGGLRALSFDLVKHAVVLEASRGLDAAMQAELATLPNVKAVYQDREILPHLYAGPDLIQLDGFHALPASTPARAGQGIRIGSIDGGIHKDAPMFQGDLFEYPSWYPAEGLGSTVANNGKIVASRTYFRQNDPPVSGDNFPWPGSGSSHGVHTAGIAAGNIVTNGAFRGNPLPTLSGVAPGAWLGNYRVFYRSQNGRTTFFTAEGVAALEDSIRDGMDVIIGSWGSGPSIDRSPYDFLDAALVNTVRASVLVAMAAGNFGPLPFTVANPSDAYVTVAAVSTTGQFKLSHARITEISDTQDPLLEDLEFLQADFGPRFTSGLSHRYPLVDSQTVSADNAQGCQVWSPRSLTASMLLVERGGCPFAQKIENAQNAGAAAVMVYNHASGGDSLLAMSADSAPRSIRIPSIFVSHGAGQTLASILQSKNAQFTLTKEARQSGNQPLVVSNFSSRGPTGYGTLKPDMAAPGAHIISQGYATSGLDARRHLGFGQTSGTSMAAPFVAGAAALLLERHPDWTDEMIKSALMSTAEFRSIQNPDGNPAQPLDMGAGLMDVTAAQNVSVFLYPPKVDFGRVRYAAPMVATTLTLSNRGDEPVTFELAPIRMTLGGEAPLTGITVEPSTITLEPGVATPVTLTLDATDLDTPSFHQGHLLFTNADMELHAPIFAWIDIPPGPHDVLLLDADLSPVRGDYALWYRTALDELALDYVYWDASAHTTKVPATLLDPGGPDTVIVFTGEHVSQSPGIRVPHVFSEDDLDTLDTFVAQGGNLLWMGKEPARLLGDSPLKARLLGTGEFRNRSDDRLAQSNLRIEARPETDGEPLAFDASRFQASLGTVTASLPDRDPWSAVMEFEMSKLAQTMDYRVSLRGPETFTVMGASLLRTTEETFAPILELPGFGRPLEAAEIFHWRGRIPLDDAWEQDRQAGLLRLRLTVADAEAGSFEIDFDIPDGVPAGDSVDLPLPLHGMSIPADEPNSTSLFSTRISPASGVWTVGLLRRETVIQPQTQEPGATLLTTFGLEHISQSEDYATRAEFLRYALEALQSPPSNQPASAP